MRIRIEHLSNPDRVDVTFTDKKGTQLYPTKILHSNDYLNIELPDYIQVVKHSTIIDQ